MLQPKDTDWLNGCKNKTHIYAVYKKPSSDLKTHRWKVRGWKNISHANGKQKKAGVAILVSDKTDLKIMITRDKEGHYRMIKGSIQEEDITIVNIYAPTMEKAVAPHSSTLAWKIPWTEEPGRLQSMGSLRVGQDSATSLSRIGEGNGNPLQCSCLENPRDGGAWWAAV